MKKKRQFGDEGIIHKPELAEMMNVDIRTISRWRECGKLDQLGIEVGLNPISSRIVFCKRQVEAALNSMRYAMPTNPVSIHLNRGSELEADLNIHVSIN